MAKKTVTLGRWLRAHEACFADAELIVSLGPTVDQVAKVLAALCSPGCGRCLRAYASDPRLWAQGRDRRLHWVREALGLRRIARPVRTIPTIVRRLKALGVR
jgi:hypothetical protein